MTAYNVGPIKFSGISSTTNSLGANDPQPGDRCSENGIEWQYFYNTGSSAVSPHFGVTVSAVAGYSCTVSTVTGVDILAGVCQNVTIATGYYGWLATRGFVTVAMGAANSAAVGDLVSLGTDGAFARHQVSGVTDGTLNPFYGKYMSAIASGGSGLVFLSVY